MAISSKCSWCGLRRRLFKVLDGRAVEWLCKECLGEYEAEEDGYVVQLT